ncbi:MULTISPECIES: hypothetical protein [unclassified Streptomyces]|uniref:hypothetical protein n=1 Tax=unclassified Streptomyces TaxID=2593676 RepID=UPI0036EE78DC
MPRLLRSARWNADSVRDEVRAYAVDHLGGDGGVPTGDEAYGQDPQLRAGLGARETGYVLAVVWSIRIRINRRISLLEGVPMLTFADFSGLGSL